MPTAATTTTTTTGKVLSMTISSVRASRLAFRFLPMGGFDCVVLLEVLHAHQLTDFDLAVFIFAERRRKTTRPFVGFIARAHLDQRVARDQFFRFRERTVDDPALPFRVL